MKLFNFDKTVTKCNIMNAGAASVIQCLSNYFEVELSDVESALKKLFVKKKKKSDISYPRPAQIVDLYNGLFDDGSSDD